MFEDGPAPFFKRLNVNSLSVEFLDLGWAQSPDEKANLIKLNEMVQAEKNILFKNTVIKRMKIDAKGVFDYIDRNIVEFEKSLSNKKIAEEIDKRNNKSNDNSNLINKTNEDKKIC